MLLFVLTGVSSQLKCQLDQRTLEQLVGFGGPFERICGLDVAQNVTHPSKNKKTTSRVWLCAGL